jgi:cytochrome c peroxidase
VLGPFQTGEMGINYGEAVQRLNADPEYLHLFQVALGSRPMIGGMSHALATFERTLISPVSRVDRFLMNNDKAILTPQEQHGFDVFSRKAPCSGCHQPFPQRQGGAVLGRPLFTDFQYHNIGIGFGSGPGGFADPGRYEHSREQKEWGWFRTPSLRNAARTAPYMHDGSLATLEEVVEFYNAGARPNPGLSPLIKPLGLDPREKAALVAFIRAMADPANGY